MKTLLSPKFSFAHQANYQFVNMFQNGTSSNETGLPRETMRRIWYNFKLNARSEEGNGEEVGERV